MYTRICIWLHTQNWKRVFVGTGLTYLFVLIGVLGADLINITKPPKAPAMIGYSLLFASYAATAATWVRLQGRRS